MVLDAETLDLAPHTDSLLAATDGDARLKREFPSAQLEIVTAPHVDVAAAVRELHDARQFAGEAARAAGLRLAAAGAHPFARGMGVLNNDGVFTGLCEEFGPIAARQLVFGLHVHVSVDGAERAVAVHDAMRSHLPELTALAANAPWYEGDDTGLATVRPVLADLLPRQGPPPVLGSVEGWAAQLAWGADAGSLPEGRRWWWELRLHPDYGTLELRVPDAQATAAEAGTIADVVVRLVANLSERYDAGELPAPAQEWRIRENRWSALRHGIDGTMADLETGSAIPTRDRLQALLEELGAPAGALGLLDDPPYRSARELARAEGARAVVASLAARFSG